MKNLNKINMVFFHGWGFDSEVFKFFSEKLNNKYEAILIDLKKYDLDYIARNILPDIPDQAVLIGWSLGGLLGVKLADLSPHKFSKIILLNTNPCFVENNNWPGVKSEIFEKFERDLDINPKKLLNKFAMLQFKGIEKYLKFPQNDLEVEVLRQGLKYLKQENIIDNLKKYNKNLLMIFSTNDNLVPVEVSEKIKLLNNSIKIKLLEGATHAPFLTQPEKLMECFDEFIQAEY